jgi:hypothetical protein
MQQQEQMGQGNNDHQHEQQMDHNQNAGHQQEPGQEVEKGKKENEKPMAVAVITPSGTFPSDDDYRRTTGSQVVAELLALAAEKLKLTNTSDWVAFVNDKELDVNSTFKQNGLHDIVEIEWHKREGGGGA